MFEVVIKFPRLSKCFLISNMSLFRSISQLKLVGSERKRNLQNQKDMLVIFEHISLTPVHKISFMHTLLLWACAYISVQMGLIRETEVSMESGRHATNFGADIVIQANQLLCRHTFFGFMGVYLGSSWLDLREIGIYRIRGTCLTF